MEAKQYPAYFVGKRVHAKTADGEVTRGTLTEIQEYRAYLLLVILIAGASVRVVNFDHVTVIEEI